MKKPCATLAISGRTSDKKDLLKSLGFRWHSTRRNWVKYADASEWRKLRAEGLRIWRKFPGEILFDCFTNESLFREGVYQYDSVPF